MSVENGIVLYSIEMDGCLNGVYTDETINGEIFNEIARKKPSSDSSNSIAGVYDCTYFEGSNISYTGELTITVIEPTEKVPTVTEKSDTKMYDFKWTFKNPPNPSFKFEGVGYLMNERQIAVRYEG